MISIGNDSFIENYVKPLHYAIFYQGGWNAGSGAYSMMAADPQKRKTFIDSVADFLDTYSFEGVDLDWVTT